MDWTPADLFADPEVDAYLARVGSVMDREDEVQRGHHVHGSYDDHFDDDPWLALMRVWARDRARAETLAAVQSLHHRREEALVALLALPGSPALVVEHSAPLWGEHPPALCRAP